MHRNRALPLGIALALLFLVGGFPEAGTAQDRRDGDVDRDAEARGDAEGGRDPDAGGYAGAAEAVWLEFAWPVGLAAEVDVDRRILRRIGGADSVVTMRSRYRMTVRAHPRGLAIAHTDGELTSFEADPELPPDNPMRAVFAGLLGEDATYIVSPDGMLLEVEGLDRSAEAMRGALAPQSGDSAVAAARAEHAGAAALSTGMLESAAAEQWGSLVWFWAWEEFRPDSVYTFSAEVPNPIVPGAGIDLQYRVGFLRFVPCVEAAAPDSCVRVETRARPTADALAALAEGWASVAADAAGADPAAVSSFDQERTFSVVLEPSTMVPYEFRSVQSLTAATNVNGTAGRDERVDETVMTFRYAEQAGAPGEEDGSQP